VVWDSCYAAKQYVHPFLALMSFSHWHVDFTPSELHRLSEMSVVPTPSTSDKEKWRWLPPRQCYFGGSGKAGFHSQLFVFVDFGTTANSFLSACGTKREPSVEEIAQMLVADPHKFYQLANGPTK
jgi:hypothetical protein